MASAMLLALLGILAWTHMEAAQQVANHTIARQAEPARLEAGGSSLCCAGALQSVADCSALGFIISPKLGLARFGPL